MTSAGFLNETGLTAIAKLRDGTATDDERQQVVELATDLVAALVPTLTPAVTSVEIPGELYAHHQDGEIVKWVFLPLASHAGYFGPSAVTFDGDADLDVENTDGPFWQAVRKTGDAAGWALTVHWEE